MKILHVIASVSRKRGGPSAAIGHIERALAARGVAVTTVTTNDDGDGATLPVACGEPVAGEHATRWHFERQTNFYVVSLPMFRWLAANIGAFDAVHVHGLFSFAPVAALLLARWKRVPCIVHPLGALMRYGMTQRRPWLKRLSFGLIERPLMTKAAAVHFASAAERTDAAALRLDCRPVVIPLGIDAAPPPGPIGSSDGAFNLLLLSRIDPVKNIESLIRALALLAPAHPELVLGIAGDGPADYVRSLHRLAQSCGVGSRIRWLGHCDGAAKSEAFARASVFVLPSHSESFGLAALEALAAGVPCIVSRDVALAADLDAARAAVVVSGDPLGIAGGIETLIRDPALRGSIAAAGQRLARESYSLDLMGARLAAMYRDICLPAQAVLRTA